MIIEDKNVKISDFAAVLLIVSLEAYTKLIESSDIPQANQRLIIDMNNSLILELRDALKKLQGSD